MIRRMSTRPRSRRSAMQGPNRIWAKRDLAADPITQFQKWMDEAIKAELPEPTAMNLATVSAQGRPSARIMLLKGCDERGSSFGTATTKAAKPRTGRNAMGCADLSLGGAGRQVRIEGHVEKYRTETPTSSHDHWPHASVPTPRHRASRLAATEALWRAWLRRPPATASCPTARRARPTGGYLIVPERVEFWRGRRSRLHDRLVYMRQFGGWHTERLAP